MNQSSEKFSAEAVNEELENNYLKGLNYPQLEAVITTEGPVLVLAGAGTGKTKALTTRIAHIINSNLAFPKQILAVTFTNKAAREMEERVANITPCMGIWLGTFHSIAARILRRHAEYFGLSSNFTIINPDDQLRQIKSIMAELNIDNKVHPAKYIVNIIERWKDQGISYDKISESDILGPTYQYAKQIYPIYQTRLVTSNACDFGDLLLYNIKLFLENKEVLEHYQNKFKYILVDEYQDTNSVQYLWIRMLAMKNKNICCVGDDDQSIYSWRGAEVGNILRFEKDFKDAKTVKLEQNYRSTQNILTAASYLIKNNRQRHNKNLWSEGDQGEIINAVSCWNEKEEARFICSEIENLAFSGQKLNQIAVLVRAGFQTRAFEEAFLANSIPYLIVGGFKFYERMEIRDLLAYIRVANNLNDNLALERIINVPKRSIGNMTLKKIKDHAIEYDISFFNAMQDLVEQNFLKGKTAQTLAELIVLFKKWHNDFKQEKPAIVAKNILEESGYLDFWKKEKTQEARDRIDNLKELVQAIADFDTIDEFIEHTSLSVDKQTDYENLKVNLMTLHAAKGLEFENVFLPGWEEGVFPHQKAITEEGEKGLEEERRIAYVGMTRAKKRLTITYAESRRIFNEYTSSYPSRFLRELPKAIVNMRSSAKGLNYMGTNHSFSMNMPEKKTSNIERSPYAPGSKVNHSKFGNGIIVSSNDDNLEIAFEKFGLKKIKANFVTLI